jgi:hypothetical protein
MPPTPEAGGVAAVTRPVPVENNEVGPLELRDQLLGDTVLHGSVVWRH